MATLVLEHVLLRTIQELISNDAPLVSFFKMSIQTKHSSVKYMLIEISLKIVIISLFSINSQCLIYRHSFYWLILNTEDFLIKNYDGKKMYILNIQESQTCTISISIHLFLLHGNWRVLRRKTCLLYSITNMYQSVIFLLFFIETMKFRMNSSNSS